jgi:hypothetical protein
VSGILIFGPTLTGSLLTTRGPRHWAGTLGGSAELFGDSFRYSTIPLTRYCQWRQHHALTRRPERNSKLRSPFNRLRRELHHRPSHENDSLGAFRRARFRAQTCYLLLVRVSKLYTHSYGRYILIPCFLVNETLARSISAECPKGRIASKDHELDSRRIIDPQIRKFSFTRAITRLAN